VARCVCRARYRLAHHGMLLLEERPEFKRHLLEGCARRLRTASQSDNPPGVLKLAAVAALAMWVYVAND
jgi:hypothetical protein